MNRIRCNVKLLPCLFNPSKLLRYSNNSSINEKDVNYYDRKAEGWWDPSGQGSMSHLHRLDPYRVQFVRDQLKRNPSIVLAGHGKPLSGLQILDVGCGVGVVCENLANLGASVTGLDPGENLIKEATRHASLNPAIKHQVEYLVSTPEAHAKLFTEKYDAVIVFFVLEHIQDRHHFLKSCISLLKPNGSLLIAHVDKNIRNGFLMCFWNPYILGLYQKSIKYSMLMNTKDLLKILHTDGCQVMNMQGMRFDWMGRDACLTNSLKYLNMIHAMK